MHKKLYFRREDDWVKKIIRIKDDYIKVCEFLEFLAKKKSYVKHEFFDEVFSYSMNEIENKGIKYFTEVYKPMRIPKGFVFKKSTSKNFDTIFNNYESIYKNKFKRRFYIGEFTELLIYIYCINKLTESEIQHLDIDWGITQILDNK